MPRSQDKRTTAENLEEKFDRGEDVLDYFDISKTRVIRPQPKSGSQPKFAYPAKANSHRSALAREKSARYRKKTR
jgi:hypothetical protein